MAAPAPSNQSSGTHTGGESEASSSSNTSRFVAPSSSVAPSTSTANQGRSFGGVS